MQKHIVSVLSLLLGLQLLLAWGLSTGNETLVAPAGRQPLLSVGAEAIQSLRLEGPNEAGLLLQRQEAGWQLQGEESVPADAARVDELLAKLLALDSSGPVATSDGAHDRLRVSDADFERRITLLGEAGELATLYLGSAPDMRSMHARVAGEDAVHAVGISAWEVPVQPESWRQPEPETQ